MNWPKLAGWACIVMACVIFWVGGCAVVAGRAAPAGADKPDPNWCGGSTAGFCNPDRHPELDPIPPDAPPVVKLRHQLAKERREHRAEVAALRAQIAVLMNERSGR